MSASLGRRRRAAACAASAPSSGLLSASSSPPSPAASGRGRAACLSRGCLPIIRRQPFRTCRSTAAASSGSAGRGRGGAPAGRLRAWRASGQSCR
eukprot:1694645-Pyramimonas_sp.AAC.1